MYGRNHFELSASDGFTIVEVLIAVVVLTAGLLALWSSLDISVKTSFNKHAREGATTLAREVAEDSYAIPFSQMSNSTIQTQLQAMPGLASSSQSSWQVVRRGITYTINASVCSIDDPKDGYGVHDSTFCPDSSKTGTADSQPLDMKRVTAKVSWSTNAGAHSVSESTTETSAGQVVGLATSALALASPPVGSAGVAGTTTQPNITLTSVTQLTFSVTAPSGATAIVWTVNGVPQTWTSSIHGTTWTSSAWAISGLSDGTYQVGAQAQDSSGVIGPATTIPVGLSRNIPSAPNVTDYGFNTNLFSSGSPTTAAEIQWQPNSELNVTGYRVYNPSGTLICTTTNSWSNSSCGTNAWCMTATACIDLAPPSPTSSNLNYQVAATYRDGQGNTQQGPATTVTLTGGDVGSFSFAPSAQNNGTNCSGTTQKDMLSPYTPGSDTLQSNGTVTFCSPGFISGDMVGGGGTATAYFDNSSSNACSVTATLNVDGSSSGQLTASNTIPKQSSTAVYPFNFTNGSPLTMSAGDKLNLSFSIPSSCTLHYGGPTYPSQFATSPLAITPP